MTKSDIAERVREKIGVTARDAAEMVETVLEIMKSTLETGEKVKINGFGIFEVKKKNDRRGRNPQTGETITLDARRVLSFRPSQLLRQAVNGAD